MSSLTDKQSIFVERYLQHWNGTRAAKEAGYRGNGNVLGVTAHRLLRNTKIRVEIEARLASELMTTNEVLWRLGDQARGIDFGEFSEDGDKLDWQKLKDAGLTHLVKGLVPTREGTKIIFHDQQKALELIGKYHAMFTEKHEIDGEIELKVVYERTDSKT